MVNLEKMELNERMLFIQKNEKFFEFQETDINGQQTDDPEEQFISCTLNMGKISLSNLVLLATDLAVYTDRYNHY